MAISAYVNTARYLFLIFALSSGIRRRPKLICREGDRHRLTRYIINISRYAYGATIAVRLFMVPQFSIENTFIRNSQLTLLEIVRSHTQMQKHYS